MKTFLLLICVVSLIGFLLPIQWIPRFLSPELWMVFTSLFVVGSIVGMILVEDFSAEDYFENPFDNN